MTPQQIEIVQTSWKKIVPMAATVEELFYMKLFMFAPDVEFLIKADIQTQGKKLITMINAVVMDLENLESLRPVIKSLGAKHKACGVRDKDYSSVGAALLWTLEQGLEKDFTDDTRLAWIEAYIAVAVTMKAGAAESV